MVRAVTVRVIGKRKADRLVFQQHHLDRRRFTPQDFEEDLAVWPGVAVPANWADTSEAFELEPSPNGHALTRFRRLVMTTPQTGLLLGRALLSEGTLVDGGYGHSWRRLDDRRYVEFYEVGMPPGAHGRARLALVHERDLAIIPMAVLDGGS